MFYAIDTSKRIPAYEQLYRLILTDIQTGRLKEGEKIPSKRRLSQRLSISLSTVENAYERLIEEGIIFSQPRKGFFVSPLNRIVLQLQPSDVLITDECEKSLLQLDSNFDFHFSTNDIDTSSFPHHTWARINKQILYNHPELMAKGDVKGEQVLRQAISKCLWRHRGIVCDSSQIIVGAGFQFMLSFLLQLLPQSDTVAVENPGPNIVFNTLETSGKKIVPIPVDSEGLSIKALRASNCDVVIVVPSRQFPMGITMSTRRREELIEWAYEEEHRFIIEDDNDCEFSFEAMNYQTLFMMDQHDKVIYINSFNRSLTPTLPYGYCILPVYMVDLVDERAIMLAPSLSRFNQHALATFVDSGQYDRHLLRAYKIYQKRRKHLCQQLEQIPKVHLSGLSGGLHILLTIPDWNESDLIALAAEERVLVHGLSEYYFEGEPENCTLVIGFAGMDEIAINDAARRLIRVLSKSYKNHKRI